MSWYSALSSTSSTRSNNPNFTDEAREKRRQELENKRLEQSKKRAARKAFLQAGVSAPPSPSTSRPPSPVRDHLLAHNLPINPVIPELDDDQLSLADNFKYDMVDAAAVTAAKAAVNISEDAQLFQNRCKEDDKEAWKKTDYKIR